MEFDFREAFLDFIAQDLPTAILGRFLKYMIFELLKKLRVRETLSRRRQKNGVVARQNESSSQSASIR